MQFHLPNLSLGQAYATNVSENAVLRAVVDLNKRRSIPYLEGYSAANKGEYIVRLLKSDKQRIVKSAQKRTWTATSARRIIVTAYSSTRDQTDATPCITANGFNVCKHNRENIIAANFLPFGARVKIPELFGDKEFVVQDRMNRRYGQRIDVWMTSRTRAKQFGVKRATIVVLSEKQKSILITPPTTQVAVNF